MTSWGGGNSGNGNSGYGSYDPPRESVISRGVRLSPSSMDGEDDHLNDDEGGGMTGEAQVVLEAERRLAPPASDRRRISPSIEDIFGFDINMAEFRVPSKDNHGHSERLWVYVLPQMLVEMSSILHSQRWPYKSNADLVRHAIYRHLKWLGVITPSPSVMGQVDAMLEVLREDEMLSAFSTVFEEAAKAVGRHMAAGHPHMAKSLLERVRTQIEGMPEGDWKTRWIREFDDRFRYQMDRLDQRP